VGVNLLREGIDLPEVALVAIMDADLESFLRDKRSLIQIIGRAARNTDSKVILYADKITGSMREAMNETSRRRTLQQDYNKKHGITPQTVKRDVIKSIVNIQELIAQASKSKKTKKQEAVTATETGGNIAERIIQLEEQMQLAAERLDFETAIALRAEWQRLKASGKAN
jgi:excinuclease ABC subunit B